MLSSSALHIEKTFPSRILFLSGCAKKNKKRKKERKKEIKEISFFNDCFVFPWEHFLFPTPRSPKSSDSITIFFWYYFLFIFSNHRSEGKISAREKSYGGLLKILTLH
eukprot:TRINITY_DN3612_c0_g1_i1.p1 TRINITY_DN3612_c0_g1~~TRINITY_DN3612_c0_g1_i1.p1  ORF type:complete len:108 (+),score=1.08 TRINITY_DN3612_c0_g1_i1:370-693(+)